MTRRRISETERARIFMASGGLCHICSNPIDGGRERWDVEHVIPLALGGDDHGDNLKPAHEICHRAGKSKADAANLARAQRQERRQLGVKRTARAVIPGSRASQWKRKLDGTAVRREP